MKTKPVTWKSYFLYILILSGFFVQSAHASTRNVSGTISSHTVWQEDTIRVFGDITINDDVVLTITPGTRVEFQG